MQGTRFSKLHLMS